MVAHDVIRRRLDKIGMLEAADTICLQFGVPFARVWSDSREGCLPRARACIYATLRLQLCWSYPQIAKFVGMDHTTMMRAVKRHCPRYVERRRAA